MNIEASPTEVQMRMILLQGEVHRLKPNYRGLRVRSGRAWITLNGCDVVLKRGEEVDLKVRHDAVVVSALGHGPVVIELLDEAPVHPTIDPRLLAGTFA